MRVCEPITQGDVPGWEWRKSAMPIAVGLNFAILFTLNASPKVIWPPPLPFEALSVTIVTPSIDTGKDDVAPPSKAPDLPAQRPMLPVTQRLQDVTPPPVAPTPLDTVPISDAPIILNAPTQETTGDAVTRSAPNGSRDYTGSRWALDPPLATDRLEGLGFKDDVDCLRSLSTDCAELRKSVFAEYQLSETDLVWTERRADTGMPSQFYGLSEREIRLKIGTKIAGENGFMIFPGIGIDGQLWDMLHGVKKGCEMKRGINRAGQYDVVRVCPDSAPAARDRKYYIPPKDEP